MNEENNRYPPIIISKRIAESPPITSPLNLGFRSFIPVPKPTRILEIIPSHPTICGTISEVTKMIEKASVPIDQQIIANLNLMSLVLNIVRAESLIEFLSTSLLSECCFASLIRLQ